MGTHEIGGRHDYRRRRIHCRRIHERVLHELVLGLKLNHPVGYSVVAVDVVLDCSAFIYFFDSLNKSIFISIGIIVDGSLSSIDIGYFLPAVGLPWRVVVNCSKLERVADTQIQLILAIFVVVLNFLNDVP